MSAPVQDETIPHDPVEEVTKHIHVVIPVAGAILIFLLAFIAVTMACRGLARAFDLPARSTRGPGHFPSDALARCLVSMARFCLSAVKKPAALPF